jgi:hypothetical protein
MACPKPYAAVNPASSAAPAAHTPQQIETTDEVGRTTHQHAASPTEACMACVIDWLHLTDSTQEQNNKTDTYALIRI